VTVAAVRVDIGAPARFLATVPAGMVTVVLPSAEVAVKVVATTPVVLLMVSVELPVKPARLVDWLVFPPVTGAEPPEG